MAVAAALLLAGCGGDDDGGGDGLRNVPDTGGLRQQVGDAASPQAADFPAVKGRSLQELADSLTGGPEAGLATRQFTPGRNRLAFGVIDTAGKFVYGKTAVYVAPTPGARAKGPFPAPADVLVTDAAVPLAPGRVRERPVRRRLRRPGAVRQAGQLVRAGRDADGRRDGRRAGVGEGPQARRRQDPRGRRGRAAACRPTRSRPPRATSRRSTRGSRPRPTSTAKSFADVVGTKPVALLFATPQLCQSRVCGPVTDIALQMQAKYGDRMDFIHQEVYVDNDPNKGLRPPLRQFNLETEPWLFVVGRDGKVTARLEGSFGLQAFEQAISTAL